MSGQWPFPGDALSTKARKMCLAYRQLATEQHQRVQELRDILDRLGVATPDTSADPVTEMDTRFRSWGETWHAEVDVHHELDDWVTSAEAGALVQRGPQTMNQARKRGRIKGRWVKPPDTNYAHWEYRVRDVYAIQDTFPARGYSPRNHTTVTVTGNGRSDTG